MIALVDPGKGPERRELFLSAVRGRPYFGDLLPAELAVFGAMRTGPVPRFFAATPGAALCVHGRGALLCGTYDPEETGGFLQLHGVEQVQTDGAPPAGYVREKRLFCMALCGGAFPPEGPAPDGTFLPGGLVLDRAPPPGEIADFLMGGKGAGARDNFYAELCIKLARGAARVWAVRQAAGAGAEAKGRTGAGSSAGAKGRTGAGSGAGDGAACGRIIATAGAYALMPETAYLAAIETAGPFRGRGIGSRLAGTLAAHLAGEDRRVALVCEENRAAFYERLGFAAESTVWRCARRAAGESGGAPV